MKTLFNLIDEPFIPVKTVDQQNRVASIRDVLVNATQYQATSASLPHVNAAVLRLLLAILHRVFGPADIDAWEELWTKRTFDPDALDAYFEKVRPGFDLFSTRRPFYQQRHPQVEEKPAQALLQLIGGGDTFTLFDHHLDETTVLLSPSEAALLLITAQSFGLAGLCHPQLKLVYTDAPCSRAAVFFVEGNNLFETLMLNLVAYNPKEPMQFAWRGDDDPPAWEMEDPYHQERTLPDGYLDYLTWQNRRISLIAEERDGQTVVARITTAPGLVLNSEVRNPMHHYTRVPGKKDGEEVIKVLRFSEGRALWRDSYALLDVNNHAIEAPRATVWVSELIGEKILPRRKIRLAAYGMCTEPGKQKVYFYRRDGFEFDNAILEAPALVGVLNTAIRHAEELRGELWKVLHQLAQEAISSVASQDVEKKPNPKDVQNLMQHWDAEGLYWNRLEIAFYRFLSNLADDPGAALEDWNQALRAAARFAYIQTVQSLGDTPRALKAAARTGGRFGYALNKVLGNDQGGTDAISSNV